MTRLSIDHENVFFIRFEYLLINNYEIYSSFFQRSPSIRGKKREKAFIVSFSISWRDIVGESERVCRRGFNA